MIVPYAVDVPMERWPIANFVILGLLVILFGWEMASSPESIAPLVLDGWGPSGLLGHMWLHAGLLHLIGNGIFLWAFGNAVCAKFGNLWYPLVYIGLGLLAAVSHLLCDDSPMIGASGAINGIVGVFLVLFPFNEVSCFYMIFIRIGTFQVSSIWMILLWFAFDLLGLLVGQGEVAYVAHLGGLAGGIILASVLLRTGLVRMDGSEKSLLHAFGWMPGPAIGEGGDGDSWESPRTSTTRNAHGFADEDLLIPGAVPAPPAQHPVRAPGADGVSSVAALCSCGRRLRAPARLAGKRVRCPACAAPVDLPPV